MNHWKRTFFLIWTGQAFSLVGSSLVSFSIVWWMTQTTGSAAVLATAALVGSLPQVFLGPFIGALVDRWNRKLVMMVADSAIALMVVGLVFLFWSGRVQIWHLYVLAFARSVGGTFHWTAMQASTSLLVPKDQLSRVAGMNQTLQGVMNIASPPLGALAMGLMPMHNILMIDVITAALAVGTLLFVVIPQPQNAQVGMTTPRTVLRDVREGIRYLRAWPGMLILMGMATLINFLLNPAGTLMPLLVTRHFGGGVWHLGAIESSWSIGIIIGGLLLSAWGGFKRKVATSALGLVMLGVGALLIGLAPGWAFAIAIGGQVISGMMNPITNGPLFALLQERIAPEMQGRVFTLVGSLAGAMTPLGLAVAAPVAEKLGLQAWFIMGGVTCVLMGIGIYVIPAVYHLEDEPAREPALALVALSPEPEDLPKAAPAD